MWWWEVTGLKIYKSILTAAKCLNLVTQLFECLPPPHKKYQKVAANTKSEEVILDMN